MSRKLWGGLWLLVALLGFAWETRYPALWARSKPLEYDEANNLQVAYRLTEFGQYATNPQDRLEFDAPPTAPRFFDPWITTGPAVMLPIAVVTRILGGWPGARGRQVAFFFFAAGMLLVPIYLGMGARSPGAVGVAMVMLAPLVGASTWNHVSLQVMGEGPGAVYFVAGALFLGIAPLFGGVLLGLAVLSKILFLVPVAALPGVVWVVRAKAGFEERFYIGAHASGLAAFSNWSSGMGRIFK